MGAVRPPDGVWDPDLWLLSRRMQYPHFPDPVSGRCRYDGEPVPCWPLRFAQCVERASFLPGRWPEHLVRLDLGEPVWPVTRIAALRRPRNPCPVAGQVPCHQVAAAEAAGCAAGAA
jgi:hypothetical protein